VRLPNDPLVELIVLTFAIGLVVGAVVALVAMMLWDTQWTGKLNPPCRRHPPDEESR